MSEGGTPGTGTRLGRDDVLAIRHVLRLGASQVEVAVMMGVRTATIQNIAEGKTHRSPEYGWEDPAHG